MLILVYIIRYSKFVYSLYKLTKDENEKNINYVNECTIKCGPIAIKLLQFILMTTNNLIKTDKLNFVLENCNVHSFEETKKLYFNETGNNIFDDYVFDSEDTIGSGSIGQVYKVYCKKRKEYIAMKIKHPDVYHNIIKAISALKIVCFCLKFINKFHNIIMEYISNIYLQIDYIQEAKNTKKLKYNFRNEELIVIPEIYEYNDTFITMSYHHGETYNNSSEHVKLIASILINFFFMTTMVVHDFIHADLHYGNWKIINENSVVKLIIYDCGLMCSTNDIDFNIQILNCVSNRKNFTNIFNIVKEKFPNNKVFVKNIKEIEETILQYKTGSDCFRYFVNKSIELKLFDNKQIVNLFSSFGVIGKAPKVGADIVARYLQSDTKSNTILYHTYIGLLTKMDKFHDLKQFFIKDLESFPENKDIYTDWLFKEFGHKKGKILNEIIYTKIYPNKD